MTEIQKKTTPGTRDLIFDILKQMSRSKTVTLNVLIVGLIVALLKFKGISLTPEETQIAVEATAVLLGIVNVGLRFVTKKPIMDKEKLME